MRQVDAMRELLEPYERDGRATVAVSYEHGDVALTVTPARATAARLVIELQEDGTINVIVGEHGILAELYAEDPAAALSEAERLVAAVMTSGAEEWISPHPWLPTGDVIGLLEIPVDGEPIVVAQNLLVVPSARRRARWAHRRYDPY